MKQFARCTNCRQWYLHTFTAIVEIYQSDARRWTTVWCRQCMTDAERRSQTPSSFTSGASGAWSSGKATGEQAYGDGGPGVEPATDFPQFMTEHLQLMDRALHEDETVLISSIEDFMQRCRISQEACGDSEPSQRLASYLQYWESFLKALCQ